MKTLLAPRAFKAIDQHAMTYPTRYIPLESHQTWTGNGISPESAYNVITAYQCTRILSNTFAQVPLNLFGKDPSGGPRLAVESPLFRTFNLQANPMPMSSFTYRQIVMQHVQRWGDHISEVVRNGDGTVELWPIHPERVDVKWGTNGTRRYFYLHGGERTELDPDRIFHFMGITTDGLRGISPIGSMRRALGLYRTAETYGEAVFRNGARPAGYLSHEKNVSAPAIERLGAQMDSLRGSGNAGKTVILEEGMSFHEVGFPPEDAQFMETRLFQKREIAAGYGVPMSMLNDPDMADEKEDQQAQKFIKQTMVPFWESFEQEAQIQIIQDDALRLNFDDTGYLRGDPKAQADANAVEWEHGNLSNDEWRKERNRGPLPDGLGAVYYRPANWVPLGEEPVAVGGDASRDTEFGQEGMLFDQTTRAKATELPKLSDAPMRQFDCPDCGKLINRMAAPGTVGYCRGCRAERTLEAEVAA